MKGICLILFLITINYCLLYSRYQQKIQAVAQYINNIHAQKNVLPHQRFVIGSNRVGFFANFFAVLNNLDWSKQHKKIPLVYWDDHNLYYQPEGYHEVYNVWEYYFEPVSQLTYQSEDIIHRSYNESKDSGLPYRAGMTPQFLSYRHWAYNIINQYIRCKPPILNKIDSFYQQYMQGKKVIGIHIRGTDKWVEAHQIPLHEIIAQTQQFPDHHFFVATDEQTILDYMKQALGDKIIYYDCYRSINGRPLHDGSHNVSVAQLGEDVLIEVQLLARCEKLIHTCSNVSTAVLFFNPTIESILLYKPFRESSTKLIITNNKK